MRQTPVSPSTNPARVDKDESERRMTIVRTISGVRLNRIGGPIRQEQASENGGNGCARLRSGAVDCACEYCTEYWRRLEAKLLDPTNGFPEE